MGVKYLQGVQAGKETTWGTGVTDTVKMMMVRECSIVPIVESNLFGEIRASAAPAYNAALAKVEGAGKLAADACYEDICYWLEGLTGVATPTGAGPYVRTGSAPIATLPTTPRFQTLFKGDSNGIYKLLGALPSKVTIKGQHNAPLTIDVDLMGKSVATGALSALSDRTVTPVMGDQCTIYLDAWGGTIGSTALANTAYAFELSLDPALLLLRYLGSLTPGAQTQRRWEPGANTLKLSADFNATSKAWLDALVGASAVVQYQVRIKYTTGATRIIQLDFAGTAAKAPEFGPERDGVVTMDLELQGTYHSTLANWFAWSVTNGVAVLP